MFAVNSIWLFMIDLFIHDWEFVLARALTERKYKRDINSEQLSLILRDQQRFGFIWFLYKCVLYHAWTNCSSWIKCLSLSVNWARYILYISLNSTYNLLTLIRSSKLYNINFVLFKLFSLKFYKKIFWLKFTLFYFFLFFITWFYHIIILHTRMLGLLFAEVISQMCEMPLLRFLCQSLLWNLSYCPGISSTLSFWELEPIYLSL